MASPRYAAALDLCDQGVLLYYKYIDLSQHQVDVEQFYLTLCEILGQKGRIRVARDGINVTVRAASPGHLCVAMHTCTHAYSV
jgi:predicted sulfurtransferase